MVNEGSHRRSDQEDSGSDDDIDTRLATARRRIHPSDCLFCPVKLDSVTSASDHMYRTHGFFIPEQEHLIDLPGLLSYLGEKIVIGNLCLFCPNGGREFGSLHAARGHMKDKGHCKIPFETNEDRAELADFYDYGFEEASDSDWEDVEDGVDEPREIKDDDRAGVSPTAESSRSSHNFSPSVSATTDFRWSCLPVESLVIDRSRDTTTNTFVLTVPLQMRRTQLD